MFEVAGRSSLVMRRLEWSARLSELPWPSLPDPAVSMEDRHARFPGRRRAPVPRGTRRPSDKSTRCEKARDASYVLSAFSANYLVSAAACASPLAASASASTPGRSC